MTNKSQKTNDKSQINLNIQYENAKSPAVLIVRFHLNFGAFYHLEFVFWNLFVICFLEFICFLSFVICFLKFIYHLEFQVYFFNMVNIYDILRQKIRCGKNCTIGMKQNVIFPIIELLWSRFKEMEP